MKILLYILMIISIGLCIFNLIQIDWENPLRDKSSVAVIGVIASASSFLLILILIVSKKIAQIHKKK
ncbi:MAG: hypothetical protein CMC11_00690 [Flavobacteriaceae bacterium]|nr:hypothetical protein [Flavobacteriaceae bacterium]